MHDSMENQARVWIALMATSAALAPPRERSGRAELASAGHGPRGGDFRTVRISVHLPFQEMA